jgi:hypothetical protein
MVAEEGREKNKSKAKGMTMLTILSPLLRFSFLLPMISNHLQVVGQQQMSPNWPWAHVGRF